MIQQRKLTVKTQKSTPLGLKLIRLINDQIIFVCGKTTPKSNLNPLIQAEAAFIFFQAT